MIALAALMLVAMTPAASAEPTLAPVLGATDWLNGQVNASDVRGRVVVLDVFTVDCINCRNVVPALRSLYQDDRSKGLTIIGIHSPETPYEKERPHVEDNLRRQGIIWPVAVDNSFALWNAYGVQAWPTQLFFDRHGRLRKTIVGDSQDDLVRSTVNELLAER